MSSIIEQLRELSLLKGVSREQMAKTVGSIKFHFAKYDAGTTLFRTGETCDQLAFILTGSVRISTANDGKCFTVEQTIGAGQAIQPDFLFGRHTKHLGTVKTMEDTSMVMIDKSEYINLLNSDPIYLFNYLNQLSMDVQKYSRGLLVACTGDAMRRISYFVSGLTQIGSTDIVIKCRRYVLPTIFGLTNDEFTAALQDLEARGIAEYSNGGFHIYDRRALIKDYVNDLAGNI